jgi:hypothetical protein
MARVPTACMAVLVPVVLVGCASLDAELQGRDYPADTAILVGDVAYQINTTKCAQIRAIAQDGTLDCFDSGGRRSAAITPVSTWRRQFVTSQYGWAWGSPEHQAFLFNYFHGGGKEQAAAAIVGAAQQAYGAYASTKSTLAMIDKSKAIDARSAQIKADGAAAYMSGGLPAWQAHQISVIQWRVQNAQYFIDHMGAAKPAPTE